MFDVIMPKMGESITEGTVLEWKKSVGDSVAKDETLLEISTDKVDSEIPSPASGTIVEIIANVNDTIPVGDVIARIGDADEKPDTSYKKISQYESVPEVKKKQTEAPAPDTVQTGKPVSIKKRFYSPLIKSIAVTEKITKEELDSISGSGKNGRVNKLDLLTYLKTRTISTSGSDTVEPTVRKTDVTMSDRVVPMSRMRKKIAEHMVQSVHTSPHVYTTVEADVTGLVNICSEQNESFRSRYGVSLTYTPMIMDATIRTIQEFPLMNASIDGDNIIHSQNINMGVAVALPDENLIVPVIHASEEKNFLGLARSTADLAARARENNLSPDEIFGSTFTLTNPGVFGGLFGMGIINQPNVGILAVGSFQKRPVVKETEYGDTIVVRHMVYLTLSYDHRIIDGVYGTKFLSRMVEIIEDYDDDRIKNYIYMIQTSTKKELRRPDWLKIKLDTSSAFLQTQKLMRDQKLNTVCEEARCPNIYECWSRNTATIMILGDTCTRSCGFCSVKTGKPIDADWDEPQRTATAVQGMNLRHVVITSVDRDDLKDDYGAKIWAETICEIRRMSPECTIEVLTPDFRNYRSAYEKVFQAQPDIFSHNIECIERISREVRPQSDWKRSLSILKASVEWGLTTKTGMMVGLGETDAEVLEVMQKIADLGIAIFNLGQYLQPTLNHLQVNRFVHPDIFNMYKKKGYEMGFSVVESGPLVRSSYHADEQVKRLTLSEN